MNDKNCLLYFQLLYPLLVYRKRWKLQKVGGVINYANNKNKENIDVSFLIKD